jgi:cytidylate kinase
VRAPDAALLETSNLSIAAAVAAAIDLVEKARKQRGR